MNTEDRIGALASCAIFDSYNSSLRKVYEEVYREKTLVWYTTKDESVCEVCSGMHGVCFDIKNTYGLLPEHPQCRCQWISLREFEGDVS
jgi:SPP1 gp7 family putative phage head morphogenesis protein